MEKIHVLDVRNSPEERKLIKNIVSLHNAQRGSKYHRTGESWFGRNYSEPKVQGDFILRKQK